MVSTSSHASKIRFAPGLFATLMASVGRLEPEHYAILAGRLDDPFRVTDIRPLPPAADAQGRARAHNAAVTLNGSFIEYYLNTELLPFGKYLLGAIHSHPGNYASLSGSARDGEGDIPTMRRHLENAKACGKPWENYLAPIVTLPGENPTITGWIVRFDQDQPIRVEIEWEDDANTVNHEDIPSIATVLAVLNRWQGPINEIAKDRKSPQEDRDYAMNVLRAFRAVEIDRLKAALRRERASGQDAL